MNTRLLFLAFLFAIGSGMAQSENFRFRKLLSEDPSTPMCFAIKNDGASTLEYLLGEKVTVKYLTKEWIYVNMSPEKIAAAEKSGAISQFYYEYSNPVALNDNDTMRVVQKVNQVHSGSGGLPDSYTGKNVIIGYIDQGLDYNHPDFRDANGHTRVLRYWDHTLPVSAQTPQPYGYGQAWDSLDIATGVCTSTESGTAHGTTVCGVGSGNGLANGKNKGVAPDSKIIVVETNFNLQNWTLTIADACDYIFKVADTVGLPAVINLSVGNYFGSHDGNDPASVLMESLLDAHPGRIIVSAAGNSGTKGKYHVHGDVDSDTSFVWLKNNPSGAIGPNTVYFDLWSDVSEFNNVQFGFGADKPAPTYGFRGYSGFHTSAQALAASPLTDVIKNAAGDTLATIEVYAETVNGAFHMEALLSNIDSTTYNFRFATKGSGSYDMWSGAWQGVNDFISVLPSAGIEPDIVHYHMPDTLQSIVSSWNCSEKVISVGNMRNRFSFTNNNNQPYVPSDLTPPGKLSGNSSKGPTRLGVMKPDVTASGDVTLSPAPLWLINNPAYNALVELGGKHANNGGTSMASPVVAGIAALYLEKCNTSTYADFKRDLTKTATSDNFTGTTPNYAYGYGKADALNTLLYSAEISGPPSYCNTPTPLTAVAGTIVNSVVWGNGSTTNPLIVNQPGTYTATVTYNGTCHAQATITIPQGTVPSTPLIAPNGTVLVSSPAANYQWHLNGNEISGETNQTITISQGGTYTVSTTGPDGCEVFSAPYQSNVGIEESSLEEIVAFPNPTTGMLEISGLKASDRMEMHDLQGKNVRINHSGNNKLDLSSLENGIYILSISRNGSQRYIKIIRN